eukprot:5898493-Prymnesium_polylepis.2
MRTLCALTSRAGTCVPARSSERPTETTAQPARSARSRPMQRTSRSNDCQMEPSAAPVAGGVVEHRRICEGRVGMPSASCGLREAEGALRGPWVENADPVGRVQFLGGQLHSQWPDRDSSARLAVAELAREWSTAYSGRLASLTLIDGLIYVIGSQCTLAARTS